MDTSLSYVEPASIASMWQGQKKLHKTTVTLVRAGNG